MLSKKHPSTDEGFQPNLAYLAQSSSGRGSGHKRRIRYEDKSSEISKQTDDPHQKVQAESQIEVENRYLKDIQTKNEVKINRLQESLNAMQRDLNIIM